MLVHHISRGCRAYLWIVRALPLPANLECCSLLLPALSGDGCECLKEEQNKMKRTARGGNWKAWMKHLIFQRGASVNGNITCNHSLTCGCLPFSCFCGAGLASQPQLRAQLRAWMSTGDGMGVLGWGCVPGHSRTSNGALLLLLLGCWLRYGAVADLLQMFPLGCFGYGGLGEVSQSSPAGGKGLADWLWWQICFCSFW